MFSANSSQVSNDKLFVEDVFSTYLYTGTGAAQTITNGIDLAGKGGMVWAKARSAAQGHILADTVRGLPSYLQSNSTSAAATWAQVLTSFNSNGFSLGTDNTINGSGNTVASWTFREAPKFFDVVTYTGDGTSNRSIAHNLGVAPGMVVVKASSTVSSWIVYHRGLGLNGALPNYLFLDRIDQQDTGNSAIWPSAPTSTTFSVGSAMNSNGQTYVAYLYAHDAGGFGNAGTDSVVSCGSFTADGSGTANVTLGWEPQWLLYKQSSGTGNWIIKDNMRGYNLTQLVNLYPNLSAAEDVATTSNVQSPTATGFTFTTALVPSATYIYMAIRRPMKTPTLGTSVFAPVAWTGTGGTATIPAGFAVDLVISKTRSTSNPPVWFDRLRGPLKYLGSSNIAAESSLAGSLTGFDNNTGVTVGADTSGGVINYSSRTFAEWMFRRAPGFFDVVCYTGSFSFRAINHNLGVVPELIITKARTDNNGFPAWYTPTTLGASTYNQLLLQDTGGGNVYSYGFGSSLGSNPTSELIYLGQNDQLNGNGPYVAYLFASCPGVSKVGEYTGNGTSQTINCGFAAGARFVMIKRTGSINSDWYVWDTARGIVSGNDPHLSLNTTATEVTTDDTIDADSSGFVVNQVAATTVNVNYASYIYLAIA